MRQDKGGRDVPSVDEYMQAATKLATTLRKAFDHPKQVRRTELRTALETFERVDTNARIRK